MSNKKKDTAFYCGECGYESVKWMGQCPACHAWNTMVEAPVRITQTPSASSRAGLSARGFAGAAGGGALPQGAAGGNRPVPLSQIRTEREIRWTTGFGELDRVLGGGVVRGSMLLVGGDPGIGKSTLLLQVSRNMAADGHSILYISGEESLHQIGMRAARIGEGIPPRRPEETGTQKDPAAPETAAAAGAEAGEAGARGIPDSLRFYCETDLETIAQVLLEEKPDVVVIDSIQTMSNASVQSAPGSVSQVRETTGVLMRLAKQTGITFFIVGHVTKEGNVAGPRVLEHMVDTVLYFEGDRYASYRIVRGVKNRFGSTNEIGVFEMGPEGLCEVENPSEYMLSGRPEQAVGSAVSCAMDGTRAMLIEVQALVCRTSFGFPKRQATGTDLSRVSLLMAVLEKRLHIPLSEYDAYVNLAGGIRHTEPSLDLGIALAVLSSYRAKPIGDEVVVFGEVGLSGEVRRVNMADIRLQEAARLGFGTCILPAGNVRGLSIPKGIEVIGVRSLAEAAELWK